MWIACLGIASLLTVGGLQESPSKEPGPGATQTRIQFFSGRVDHLADAKITVIREVGDKPSEARTFLVTEDTTIEGEIREKARVTVGYVETECGETAVRIIVRSSSADRKRPSKTEQGSRPSLRFWRSFVPI